MKTFVIFSALSAAISPVFASVVARQSKGNLPPVTVRGNAFFAGSSRFYVRGVAYQPGLYFKYRIKDSTYLHKYRWCG
jgi:hypothetical protein